MIPRSTWDIGDYTGNYHLRRIQRKHPIPGSQLARESDRRHEAVERTRRPERLVEAQQSRSRHALSQAETIRVNLEQVRSTYGWQANAAISENLVAQIDVSTKTFADRREPSVAKAWAQDYTPLQHKLLQAIQARNYRDCHALFLAPDGSAPPNCDFSVNHNSTPLQQAVRVGDVRMTKLLIREGRADVNYPNSMGIPSLFYVFEEWRTQILNKDPAKESLIVLLDRAVELITLIGGAGGNVNALGLGGETPVHVAAGLGHARHLFLLCKFGFDPTLRNNVGQLAVDVARAQKKTECVIILTEFSKIKRTVELEIFRDSWKPFLLSNTDAKNPRSMHVNQTTEEILHDLMLKDRVRRNDIMERNLQFGTTVKFVRDNDDVLARDGGDEDAAVLQTEVALQAMRNALNTRGVNAHELTTKQLEEEKQRIAKDQALQYRKGGLSRQARHRMKKERTNHRYVRFRQNTMFLIGFDFFFLFYQCQLKLKVY